MPAGGRRIAGQGPGVWTIRYDTKMASTAAFDGRARWGGAGRWQRRARLTLRISPLASLTTCHRDFSRLDGGVGFNLLDEDVFRLPACTFERTYHEL